MGNNTWRWSDLMLPLPFRAARRDGVAFWGSHLYQGIAFSAGSHLWRCSWLMANEYMMVGMQWDATLLLWINKPQRVMEKSNYLCFPYSYRKALECLESLLEILTELFKKFYNCFFLWISWREIQDRKENSVSSCGLGNQILYILCLWDTRKNNLIMFLNKNKIFFLFIFLGGNRNCLWISVITPTSHSIEHLIT